MVGSHRRLCSEQEQLRAARLEVPFFLQSQNNVKGACSAVWLYRFDRGVGRWGHGVLGHITHHHKLSGIKQPPCCSDPRTCGHDSSWAGTSGASTWRDAGRAGPGKRQVQQGLKPALGGGCSSRPEDPLAPSRGGVRDSFWERGATREPALREEWAQGPGLLWPSLRSPRTSFPPLRWLKESQSSDFRGGAPCLNGKHLKNNSSLVKCHHNEP